MFGRLTLNDFKHNPIEMGAGVGMFLALLGAIIFLSYTKRWGWLWREWFTSLDPKRIGVMYIVTSVLMLAKGLIDAGMMRGQQMLSAGDAHGFLSASHFQQVFTVHGVAMIFFVAMGIVFGLMNLVIPLQIGARDVAFPLVNSIGFWLFAAGALLVNVSLVVGQFSAAGWSGYPPLSGLEYSPGVGVDYWIWSLQVSGAGSLMSGINFLVTIVKMRCPGMTLMKMPLFVWCSFATVILVVFAFPILTATLALLSLDRLMGMHFFTSSFGGSPMLFVNLFWAWGHPEVYILILPAFGIFSEVVATFSSKRLFGYVSMVWAIIAITFLSFIVWLHHFFTMGAGPTVNAFFGIMTMLIAIPTGVKIFNWLFTKYQGRVEFKTPILWFLAFVITFSLGGMAGVLLSVPAVDFQLHNSLFLIAHFHSMIIPGVLFAVFAGFTYWFPKFTGFKLNERWGVYAFWCWVVGFLLAFMPLYILGLMGATRRLDHYELATGWQPLFTVAMAGYLVTFLGFCCQLIQVYVSYKEREKNRDTTGDPWNGRTLEWSTSSPPPEYNFAIEPVVHTRDPFWEMKQHPSHTTPKHYEDILMPKNSGLGFYMGALSFLFAFAITWHIFWLVIGSTLGLLVCLFVRFMDPQPEYVLTAKEVETEENRLA